MRLSAADCKSGFMALLQTLQGTLPLKIDHRSYVSTPPPSYATALLLQYMNLEPPLLLDDWGELEGCSNSLFQQPKKYCLQSGRSSGRGTYTARAVNAVPLLKVGRKASIFRPTFDDLMSSN